MKAAHLAMLLAALCALAAPAQRTTRTGLRLDPARLAVSQAVDTLAAIGPDSAATCLKLNGFEKTLRSRQESVHATNLLAADTIVSLEIRIDYLDLKGRQLHSRTVSVDCEIPPGQTRLLTFPSWDRQQVWHYRLSKPPRSGAQATPFDVKLTPRLIMTRSVQPDPPLPSS